MADRTKIQWAEATWNVTYGCERVSAGCAQCYAIQQMRRLVDLGRPDALGIVEQQPNGQWDWTGRVVTLPDRLDQPLWWKRPRRIFVDSVSDLFHEGVPPSYLARVFSVMAVCHWHTFQVLTKRPERMALLLPGLRFACRGRPDITLCPALPNVWLGTSVEDQCVADERLPHLMATPAAVRFASVEPLLGPADLRAWLNGTPRLSWVIVGGESGPKARPLKMDWVRSILADCRVADVPVFIKQLGSHWAWSVGGRHPKGGDPNEWPDDVRVRRWPR